jgi:hypothetical protein
MIFYLKQDLVATNEKGETILELKSGMQFTAINWDYVPEWAFENAYDFQIEKMRKDAFCVYFRGRWVLVPKNLCEVPKTIGWRANV